LYAALDDAARDVLMSPFAEEVAGYEPVASPLELKGAVAVVVRGSLPEQAPLAGAGGSGRHQGYRDRGGGTAVAFPGRPAPAPGAGDV
jgi:hypothetical protein